MVTLAVLLMSGAVLVSLKFREMRMLDAMLNQLESIQSQDN
jgi:hypothetical protein